MAPAGGSRREVPAAASGGLVATWARDPVLPGFEAVTIPLPAEDDGPLVATLVRRRAANTTGRAVLHVHGFVDYFFHAHVANALVARGWDVYAIDLRRSGRSLREGNRPYYAGDMREYFPEISLAIGAITRESSHRLLCLTGHSTGGLIAALYAHDGAERSRVQALALNSPFVDFNASAPERAALALVSAVGAVMPHLPIPGVLAPSYVQGLHRSLRGEWEFDLRWKPEAGFPAYAGWLRAVRRAHAEVRGGLGLSQPVLLLRSDASFRSRGWDPRVQQHDSVLDVAHMVRAIPQLGRSVTDAPIAGAMHDVFLSAPPVRARAIDAYGAWLDARPVPARLGAAAR